VCRGDSESKFLGTQIDNHLNWLNYIEQIIFKLHATCFSIRLLVHISSMITLKSMYYAYFNSIIKYGIIFWSNSFNIRKRFTSQKQVIRIMAGAQHRTLHRSLFEQLEILPVPCQYILSLINFIINNWENFQTNSSIHNINTRNKHQLHRPYAKLPCFQKSTFYAGIKISNNLPLSGQYSRMTRQNLKQS